VKALPPRRVTMFQGFMWFVENVFYFIVGADKFYRWSASANFFERWH